MKGFAFSPRGFSDVCANELREHGARILMLDENAVEFEAGPVVVCQLVYSCQSVTKFILGGVWHNISSMKDVVSLAENLDVHPWIQEKKTFRASAVSEDAAFSSQDVMRCVGESIGKRITLEVDLSHPNVLFHVHIAHGKAYIGIDVVPFDISKRAYKIFHAASSIKGTLGYCLVRWSGYDGKGILLDPCAGVGVIPIEAALFASGKSPHFFKKDTFKLAEFGPLSGVDEDNIYAECDKRTTEISTSIYCFDRLLPMVKAAQKNAKIAGVEKLITTMKCDLELDTKLNKGEVDYIVTQPPAFTLNQDTEKKFFDVFFSAAEHVVNKNGTVAMLCVNIPLKEAEKYHFTLHEQRTVYGGKQKWLAAKFRKH